jgi:hypothetical protein
MGDKTLAQLIKAQFPGEYDEYDDRELEDLIIAKYPGEYDDYPRTEMPMGDLTKDIGGGLVKGLAQTVSDFSGLAPRMFGAPDPRAKGGAMHGITEFAQPKTKGEAVGKFIEQVGEFAIPGMSGEAVGAKLASKAPKLLRLPVRIGVNAGTNAAQAALHEDDATVAGVAGGAGTVAGAGVFGIGRWVGSKAKPLVNSGLKLTDSSLSKQSTAKFKGLAGEQDAVAEFALKKRWLDPAEAEANLARIEAERNAMYATSPAKFNAGQTANQALSDLADRARLRTDGGVKTLAAVEKEKRRLLTGPLSKPGAPKPKTPVATPSGPGWTGPALGTAPPGGPVFLDLKPNPGVQPEVPPAWAPSTATAAPTDSLLTTLTPTERAPAVVPSPFSASTATPFSLGGTAPPAVKWRPKPVTLPSPTVVVPGGRSFTAASSDVPAAGRPVTLTPTLPPSRGSVTASSTDIPPAQPPVAMRIAAGKSAPKSKKLAVKREFRDDVTAAEMKQHIEADGEELRDQWGQRKVNPALKAKNAAMRRSLQEGVDAKLPQGATTSADLLEESGLSQRLKKGLDASKKRRANLGPFSAPLLIGTGSAATSAAFGSGEAAAASLALAVGGHLIRNNPTRAGYLAADLAEAVANKNGVKAARILKHLGVGLSATESQDREGSMTITEPK